MNLLNLLFREVPPVTRTCTLCGAELLLVRDNNDKRLALDAKPMRQGYYVPAMVRTRWPLRGQLVAGAFKQEYHTSHAETCPVKRRAANGYYVPAAE